MPVVARAVDAGHGARGEGRAGAARGRAPQRVGVGSALAGRSGRDGAVVRLGAGQAGRDRAAASGRVVVAGAAVDRADRADRAVIGSGTHRAVRLLLATNPCKEAPSCTLGWQHRCQRAIIALGAAKTAIHRGNIGEIVVCA